MRLPRQEIVPPLRLPRSLMPVGALLVLLALVILPLYAVPFVNFTICMIMVYAVVGMGLNFLTGYTGQISIGHNAFVAFGAYTAAALAERGVSVYLAFPLAGVLCFAVGFLLGLPALRMGGLQFALVTLALALVLPAIIIRLSFVTGGANGLSLSVQSPGWSGLATDQFVYYVCLLASVILLVVFLRLTAGRVGRSLIAIRDYEGVAKSVGVRTALVKTQAFAISGVFAGAGGVLYALVVQYVAPDSFGLNMSIAFITMIVVGGLSTTVGAVLGAIFVQLVPQLTNGVSGAGWVYGITLMFFVFFLPFGVVGVIRLIGHSISALGLGATTKSKIRPAARSEG